MCCVDSVIISGSTATDQWEISKAMQEFRRLATYSLAYFNLLNQTDLQNSRQ